MGDRFGRYELGDLIGRGGMAEVSRARYEVAPGLTKEVVLKRILPAFADLPEFRSMFLAEMRLTMRLSHGNVVQVFDAGEIDGQLFLTMEWVDGVSLDLVLQRAFDKGLKGLPPVLAVLVIIEVLKGLHHAHTRKDESGQLLNLVHRDISPDNVLVSYEGDVKVSDFGIAKASLAGRDLTSPGFFKGKLMYGAPEQARGESVDARADVYSTALVLYELVSGTNPCGEDFFAIGVANGTREIPRFPVQMADPEFVNIITRALSPFPADRYPGVLAFQQALMQWSATRAGEHAASGVAHLMRWLFGDELQRRHPGVALGAAADNWLELARTGMYQRPRKATLPEEPTDRGAPLPPQPPPAPAPGGLNLRQVQAIGIGVAVLLVPLGFFVHWNGPRPHYENLTDLPPAEVKIPGPPTGEKPGPVTAEPLDAGAAVAVKASVFNAFGAPAAFELTPAHQMFLDGTTFFEWNEKSRLRLDKAPALNDSGVIKDKMPLFAGQLVAGRLVLTRLLPGKVETLSPQKGEVRVFTVSFDDSSRFANVDPGVLDVSGKKRPLKSGFLQFVAPDRRVTLEGLSPKRAYTLIVGPVKEPGRGTAVLVEGHGEKGGRPMVAGQERIAVLTAGEYLVTGVKSLLFAVPTLSGAGPEALRVTVDAVEGRASPDKSGQAPRAAPVAQFPPLASDVPEAKPWFDRGHAAFGSNQLAVAQESFAKALRLDPRNANGHYYAAATAARLGDAREAQFQYQLFLKLASADHPNRAEVQSLVRAAEKQR